MGMEYVFFSQAHAVKIGPSPWKARLELNKQMEAYPSLRREWKEFREKSINSKQSPAIWLKNH